MRVGQTWKFTNILGDTQLAEVIEYLPNAPFQYYIPQSQTLTTITYKDVFEVQYGSYFMIYWAPGFGAAHAVSTYPGVVYPYATAFNWATPTPNPTATPAR